MVSVAFIVILGAILRGRLSHVKALPIIHVTPERQNVSEGTNATVNCSASVNATNLNFTWNKVGNDAVLAYSNLLILPNINRSDDGSYSCSATNGTTNWHAAAIINVMYKPTIHRRNTTVIETWLHHSSALDCWADGNPTPQVTWSKDGTPLSSSGTITIIPKKVKDFGSYKCTGKNILGKDHLVFTLKRSAFPPSPPKILNTDTELKNRSFILHWVNQSDNGRPILRYTVWQRTHFPNITTLSWNISTEVRQYELCFNWGMSYQVALTAENDQGTSNKSKINITVMLEPTKEPSVPLTTREPTKEPSVPLTTREPTKEPSVPLTTRGGGSSLELVVGLSLGGVILMVLVIITAACYFRKKPKHKGVIQPRLKSRYGSSKGRSCGFYSMAMQDLSTRASDSDPKKRKAESLFPANHAIYVNLSHSEDKPRDWEFPRQKLHIEKEIGKGAFCVVVRAVAEGLGTVAVKTPKETALDTNKKDLLAEYRVLQHLKPHPNVIQLLGGVTRSDPIMVMFEYIPYGDLLGFLRRSRGLHDNYYKDPDIKPSSSLTSDQLLRFAREISDGMAFLSTNKIIHRDLAARNVLVGEGEICKITDFGMARDVQLNEIYQKRTKGRVPVKWTAYESLLYGFSTTQSDVWSYGIVLFEIFTIGGCPYPNISPHKIPYMIQKGYRMPKPAHLDNDIYALMCECWKTEPELRPSFLSISKTIKRLEQSHKNIIYMNVYDEKLYANVEDWD